MSQRLNLVAFAKLIADDPIAPWQERVLELIERHPGAHLVQRRRWGEVFHYNAVCAHLQHRIPLIRSHLKP